MFEHILVPLDGSSLAECVLPHAVAMASAFDSEITLLRVSENSEAAQDVFPDLVQWRLGEIEARTYLDEWTDRLRAVGVRASGVLLEGRPAERIIGFARDHQVNLILLSSHGQSGLGEWNLSGVVQKIIMRAYTSVMFVPAQHTVTGELAGIHYRRMLVPLDCSQRAESVLPLASELALVHKSRLELAHVVTTPQVPHREPLSHNITEQIEHLTEYSKNEARSYLEDLRPRLPSGAQTHLLVSNDVVEPLHRLIAEEGIDLVIIGAHGEGNSTRWPYGSTALNFIVYGTTPLLILQDHPISQVGHLPVQTATREIVRP